MMKLGLPNRVVDLDVKNAVFNPKGLGVFGDLRAHGGFPAAEGFGFLDTFCEGWVTGLGLSKNVEETVKCHGIAVANMNLRFSLAALVLAFALFSFTVMGCGYRLQRSGQESLLTQKGIRRIYIQPVANQSYKAGADHVVYNELLRAIAASEQIRVVRTKEESDAILRGAVVSAGYNASATTFARGVFPQNVIAEDIPVATEYTASLYCAFVLVQTPKLGGVEKTLWTSQFSRSKPFPGNNQIGTFGTTSGLINESEFDRALRDMAESMMADVNEAMFSMF